MGIVSICCMLLSSCAGVFLGAPVSAQAFENQEGNLTKSLLYTYKKDLFSSEENNQEKMRLIDQLLELSGVKKQVDFISSHINAQLLQQREKFEPQVYDRLSRILTECYRAGRLYETVRIYFRNNSNEDQLLSLLNWNFSPLSEKMVFLEAEATGPEVATKMKDFFEEFSANPALKERLLLMERLNKASGSTELYVKMVLAATLGFFEVTEPLIPIEFREANRSGFTGMFTSMHNGLETSLGNGVVPSLLYTYRDVTAEDLKKYIDFWESEDGRWFNKISGDSFVEAIVQANKSAAVGIAEISSPYRNR